MLENFIFSANAVVPIFLLIAFGYFLRKKNYIDENTIDIMNNIVFKFALPAMLFQNIAQSNFRDSFDFWFLTWIVIITLGTFLFSWVFAELFMKDKGAIGAFVQGSFRGNYTILGLSVISSILGDSDTGKSILVTTFIVPLYNILSILVLSVRNYDTDKDGKLGDVLKSAFINIVKNPLIIGIMLGIPFSYFNFNAPTMLVSTCTYLGNLSMPLALIAIGGNIDLKTSFVDVKWALIASSFKELLFPIIGVLSSVLLFNMQGEKLVIIFVMTSTPTAVSSYVMASNMHSDSKLASNIILFTTLCSLFTFTAGIYILKTLNLI